MFELCENKDGEKLLFWFEGRRSGQRGLWVEIGHESDKGMSRLITVNKNAGLQVEKDYKGFYRALVLSD